jgi:hypothetical protein
LLAHWSGVEGKAESRSLRPDVGCRENVHQLNFGTSSLLLSLISEVYEGLVSDSKEASITNFRLSTHSFASLTKVGCGILSQGMCVTDATPIAAELHHHAIDSGFPPLVSFGQQRSGCAYA